MTSFSDDFNRADSTDLGAGWVEVSGDWSIVSNRLSPGNAGGTIILRAATAMATSDHYVQITIATTTAASQGIWARGNSNITSGYLWRNNGSTWDLFSVVGGSFTNIGTYSAAAGAGDVAKIQVQGTTITGYVNGVSRVSVTDSAVASGTNVGVRGESTNLLSYDDFSAADVSSGVSANAGNAAGTGAAGAPTITVAPNAAAVSGTGTAGTATASISVNAGHPAGTGAAGTPTSTIGASAGAVSAVGAASDGVAAISPRAGASTGAGTAGAPTVATADNTVLAAAGHAGGTGTAGTPTVHVVGAPIETGSWYGLLDILREGAQLYRTEQETDRVACPDCGEPLRAGPRSERYCPFDGSVWGAGGRLVGHVGERR